MCGTFGSFPAYTSCGRHAAHPRHPSPHRPSWVPGRNPVKTSVSELSDTYSGVIGNFPKNDVWLDRGNAVQILDVPVAASTNLPEKARYREGFSMRVSPTAGCGRSRCWR